MNSDLPYWPRELLEQRDRRGLRLQRCAMYMERLVVEQGMTQKSIAGTIGVAPSVVSWWRMGKGAPSYQNLIKLRELVFGNVVA